jgi:hypothetical protein
VRGNDRIATTFFGYFTQNCIHIFCNTKYILGICKGGLELRVTGILADYAALLHFATSSFLAQVIL